MTNWAEIDRDPREFGLTRQELANAGRTVTTPVAAPAPSSWTQVDLGPILAGDLSPLEATRMARIDGVLMLYPGRIHDFHGQPESLKSWCAQVVVAEILTADLEALYIDFEAEARDVVGHLLALGVSKQQLHFGLHYIRPDEPFSEAARVRLLADLDYWTLDVSIVDGVNNAMASNALDPKSGPDYRKWFDLLARPVQLATTGPTVLIDHVAKDKEHRGDWAIGTESKLASIDGASFTFDLVQPFGRQRTGLSRLLLAKDRPGGLRGHAMGKELCRLKLTSSAEGAVTYEFLVPSGLTEGEDGEPQWRPTFYMQKVSELVESSSTPLSRNGITGAITGKVTYIRQAIQILIDDGFIEAYGGPNRSILHRSLLPYVAPSDEYVPGASPVRPESRGVPGSGASPVEGGPLGPPRRDALDLEAKSTTETETNGTHPTPPPGIVQKVCPGCGASDWRLVGEQRHCRACSEVWTP